MGLLALFLIGINLGHAQTTQEVKWAETIKTGRYLTSLPIGVVDSKYQLCNADLKSSGIALGTPFGVVAKIDHVNGSLWFHTFNPSLGTSSRECQIEDGEIPYMDFSSYGVFSTGDVVYQYHRIINEEENTQALELRVASISPIEVEPLVTNTLWDCGANVHTRVLQATSPSGEYTVLQSTITATNGPGSIYSNREVTQRPHATTIFNRKGEVVSHKSYFLGETERFYLSRVEINDLGKVVLYGHGGNFFNEKTNTSLFAWNYSNRFNRLYYLDQELPKPKLLSLNWPEEEYIHSMFFAMDDYSIHCAALLTDVKRHVDVKFRLSVKEISFKGEKTKEVSRKMRHGLLGTSLSDKDKKRMEKGRSVGLGSPVLRYLRPTDNGGYLVCMEEMDRTTKGGSTTGTTEYSIYQFSNICALEVDGEGTLLWNYLIPKKQSIIESTAAGTAYIDDSQDYLTFFFNANADTEYGQPEEFTLTTKRKTIHITQLNLNGELVFDKEIANESDLPIIPELCASDGNKVFLVGQERKSQSIGIVNLFD